MYAPELIYTIIMIKSLSLSIQDLLQNDHSFIVKIIIWLKIPYVIDKIIEDVYVFFQLNRWKHILTELSLFSRSLIVINLHLHRRYFYSDLVWRIDDYLSLKTCAVCRRNFQPWMLINWICFKEFESV